MGLGVVNDIFGPLALAVAGFDFLKRGSDRAALEAAPGHAMRSLVLAGGGMRVAWQAGVVKALNDAGLTFDHVDGTSGGIMTAGMILSGLTPEEMCERWSTLDVQDFNSPLAVGDYLKGPWNLPGLADADGIWSTSSPSGHRRGGDLAVGDAAPFNVSDFGTKTCVPSRTPRSTSSAGRRDVPAAVHASR